MSAKLTPAQKGKAKPRALSNMGHYVTEIGHACQIPSRTESLDHGAQAKLVYQPAAEVAGLRNHQCPV